MVYGIQNLRRAAVFDQMTPGSRSYNEYSDNPVISDGQPDIDRYEPQDTRILGPDGTPLDEQTAPPSGLAKLADISVDPNKGTEQERLREHLDTINSAYTPSYISRDRNDRLLDDAPTRGQPTNWDRTAAILMSLGQKDALGIQEKVLQAPYYQKAEEFKLKSEPFYKAAELENKDNTNTRQVLGTAATSYTAAERNRIAQENNEARNENVRQRNIIADYVARGARQVDAPHSPTIIMKKPDGTTFDTGVPSGALSEAESIRAKGAFQVEAAQAAGAGFYQAPSGEIVTGNPRTGQIPPPNSTRVPSAGSGGGSSTSQLEKNRVEQEIMKQQRQTDPAAKGYMKSDGKGGYTWADRPVEGSVVNGWFGTEYGGKTITAEDVAQYDAYRKEANPDYVPRVKGLGSSKVPNVGKVPGEVYNETTPQDNGAPAPGKGIAGGTGPNYKLRRNPKNPNEMARTLDGKTWQKSTDGGRTWR